MARGFEWEKGLLSSNIFPYIVQILSVFLRFKLLPNFIFQCYRHQTWQFYLFFPALSISAKFHEVLGIKFKGRKVMQPLAAKGKC